MHQKSIATNSANQKLPMHSISGNLVPTVCESFQQTYKVAESDV